MTDREKAIALFASIERLKCVARYEPDPGDDDGEAEVWEEPIFDVRLDAYSHESPAGNTERHWRVRVTWTKSRYVEDRNEELKRIIDYASEAEVEARMDNSAIVLE